MYFTIFMPIVVVAVLTVAMAELDQKPNGTVIPLFTKFPSLLKADETVNLNVLYSHIASVDIKVQRGLEYYEKNTGTPHPLAVRGIESDSDPSDLNRAGVGASLTNYNNGMWYSTIWIGTPARSLTVSIDTGSSDLFVPGPTCALGCEGHTKWDPESSQTSNDKKMEFEITFSDGASVSGEQFIDNVTITGLTANHQTIGVAKTYSQNMKVNEFPADGMLGMAFQSISLFSDSPVFETLINEGKVKEPVFSVKLSPIGGELYLGGSNTDLYTGDIVYTNVVVVGFWQVVIANIQGNGGLLATNVAAIVDTGSNFIIGDLPSVSYLHKKLGGKRETREYYSFPCKNFPTISFTFGGTGGRKFKIPASLLNLGPTLDGSSDCWSAIVSGGRERKQWNIGGPFLQSVYTVFDFGNKRVGFADLAT